MGRSRCYTVCDVSFRQELPGVPAAETSFIMVRAILLLTIRKRGRMSGFESFGISHIMWLFILGITGAAAVRYCPACGRKAGAVLAVLGRILPVLYEIGKGTYGLSFLPLHVCSMTGYGCFLHWLLSCRRAGNDTRAADLTGIDTLITVLSELLFFPGLPGALLALLKENILTR